MNLSRVFLSGLILILMVPAFAEDASSQQNNTSVSVQTVLVTTTENPNDFSKIEQFQAKQQFNSNVRDRDRSQLDQARRNNSTNTNYLLEKNSNLGSKGYFLADSRLGNKGDVHAESHNVSGDGSPVGSADNYDLNSGYTSGNQTNNYPRYVYYKQSVTVVSPNSPLYEGQASNSVATSVTTGQQVANRNANQNVLFFCTAGNRAQTAEAFKQVESADLDVWTDLESFNKCKAWAVKPEVNRNGH